IHVFFLFFFQAEDGIRDLIVTGVQTCALPIWSNGNKRGWKNSCGRRKSSKRSAHSPAALPTTSTTSWVRSFLTRSSPGSTIRTRSEERRVGKECRARWAPDQ